jgi:hypothetical protein
MNQEPTMATDAIKIWEGDTSTINDDPTESAPAPSHVRALWVPKDAWLVVEMRGEDRMGDPKWDPCDRKEWRHRLVEAFILRRAVDHVLHSVHPEKIWPPEGQAVARPGVP